MECPVCLSVPRATFAYRCRHTVCTECAIAWCHARAGVIVCPLCRTTGAPPATCISALPDPGFGLQPYRSSSPEYLVRVMLGSDTAATVNVAELRAAPPLQHVLTVPF